MSDLLRTVGDSIGNVLFKAPQTQQDINSIAQVSNQVQSPQFQQELQQVETGVKAYAGVTVFLQLLSTGAVCVLAYIAWKNFKRDKK